MAGNEPRLDSPKTRAGRRTIGIDPATAAALRAWRATQAEERLAMGAVWRDSGLVITEPTGEPVHPQVLTRRFKALAASAGLPAIRLYDVRHSYASAALLAGVPIKVVSERLGHADISITLRTYVHVLPHKDADAAALVASVILKGS